MKITKEKIIKITSDIANQKGLSSISLKVIAEELGIKTPSLYNHIESLDDLLRGVAHVGMREMNDKMKESVIGKIGDESIIVVGVEYFKYIIVNPGIYEVIQWVGWHRNDETNFILSDYQELLKKLIRSCNFREEKIEDILTLITSIFHGYSSLELAKALEDKEDVLLKFEENLDVVLSGLHLKYDK